MHRYSLSHKIIAVVAAVVLLAAFAVGGYYVGTQQQARQIKQLQAERIEREREYGKALDQIRGERDRAGVDYQTACTEYQLLRSAYEKLYQQAGTQGEKYSSPDDARGNENSCYR